jgi:serine/threonine protein kinase
MGPRASKQIIDADQHPTGTPFWQDASEVDVAEKETGRNGIQLLRKIYTSYAYKWTVPTLSWKYIDLPLRQVTSGDEPPIRQVTSGNEPPNFKPGDYFFLGAPAGDDRRNNYIILGAEDDYSLGEGSFGEVLKFTTTRYTDAGPSKKGFPDIIAVKKFNSINPEVLQELFVLSHLIDQKNYSDYVPQFYFMISWTRDFIETKMGYAMECAEISLQDYVIYNGRDSYKADANKTKIGIVKDLVHALDFLHNTDTVHMDIKPNNVLLFRDAQKQRLVAKLADFGSSLILKPTYVRTTAQSQLGDEEGEIHVEIVSPNPFYSSTDYCIPSVKPLEYFLSLPSRLHNKEFLKSVDIFCLGKVIQVIMHNSNKNYYGVSNFNSFIKVHGYASMSALKNLTDLVINDIETFPQDLSAAKERQLTEHFLGLVVDFTGNVKDYLTVNMVSDPEYDVAGLLLSGTRFDRMLELDYVTRHNEKRNMRRYAEQLAAFEVKKTPDDEKLSPMDYFRGFGQSRPPFALTKAEFSNLVGTALGENIKNDIKKIDDLVAKLKETLQPTN